MRKLMDVNLMRLWKDRTLRICAAVMAVIGATVALMTGGDNPESFVIDSTFYGYLLPLEFACAVFCALFIGTDTGDGTIRNKLIVGHGRASIYLANLAVCSLAGLLLGCAYIVPMLAIGVPRLGFFTMDAATVLALVGTTCAATFAACALFTLVGMLGRSRAASAVICLVGAIALLFAAVYVNGRLEEPETYDNFAYTSNSGDMIEQPAEPNPNYLSGAKRAAFQFALEISPMGQAVMFADMSIVCLWRLPLYSLGALLLSTALGLILFKRKDIR